MASPRALMILPEDIEHQSKAATGRRQKAKHGQAGVAKNLERSLHAHQKRGPDN